MKTKTSKLVKIETATIEAAAADCSTTPADYVARSVGFYEGRKLTARAVGTEDGGRVTAFELRTAADRVQAAFGNRRHTRRELDRARAKLMAVYGEYSKLTERLAAKYGCTPAEIVANAERVLRTPNGSSADTCGLQPTEARDVALERLAVKYRRPVAEVRAMSADELARMVAEGRRSRAGARG